MRLISSLLRWLHDSMNYLKPVQADRNGQSMKAGGFFNPRKTHTSRLFRNLRLKLVVL